MEGIKYRSPRESADDELKQHRFDLVIDNQKIGSAELDYFSQPVPLYQLTDLYVDYEQQGNGHASQLMDTVEEWLRSRKKPGVLVDAISEGNMAEGMYTRRGWQEVPGQDGLHVYNWPEQMDLSVLRGYSFRQTPLNERKGIKD